MQEPVRTKGTYGTLVPHLVTTTDFLALVNGYGWQMTDKTDRFVCELNGMQPIICLWYFVGCDFFITDTDLENLHKAIKAICACGLQPTCMQKTPHAPSDGTLSVAKPHKVPPVWADRRTDRRTSKGTHISASWQIKNLSSAKSRVMNPNTCIPLVV